MAEIDLSNFPNMELDGEPGKLHDNGWQRVSLWQQVNGGIWGDDAIAGFTSYYEKPGTNWKAEISYYVETTETFNQPEIVPKLVVSGVVQVWQEVDSDQNNLEMEYIDGSVLYYDTFESAIGEARRLGKMDESYVFTV